MGCKLLTSPGVADVRGSPLAAIDDTWDSRMHGIFGYAYTHARCTSQVRSMPFSGGSYLSQGDCRQPRLVKVFTTTKPYWDDHVHRQC